MNPFFWHNNTRLTDLDIELLLSASPEASDEHADLQWFLTALADQRPAPPHDVERMATALASVARSTVPVTRPTQPRKAVRRMVALAATFGLLFAMSGIALAADDAVPGDLLYGIDRAFELIGVGDGEVDERIAEFDALIARGDDEAAYELLEEVIESSSESESAKAQAYLNVVAANSEKRAGVADDNVAAHQQFIEENKKNGVGADGKDFGQGVADIVSERDKDLPEQAEADKLDTPAGNDGETGPPDQAASPNDPPAQSNSGGNQGGQSDSNANDRKGPPKDTGNSGNGQSTDSGESKSGNGTGTGAETKPDPGPPDNAGRKDK
jgi:hypothetical protein